MAKHASLMDIFGAATDLSSMFLRRDTDRLKAQNDHDLRLAQERESAFEKNWMRDNPYTGAETEEAYTQRFQSALQGWYHQNAGANTSPYYARQRDRMRDMSLAASGGAYPGVGGPVAGTTARNRVEKHGGAAHGTYGELAAG